MRLTYSNILAILAMILLCGFAGPVAAQSLEPRLRSLEQRVTALESGTPAARPPAPGAPPIAAIAKMFGPMRMELLGCNAAGGDSGKAKCRFVVTNTGSGPAQFGLYITSVTNDERQSDNDASRQMSVSDPYFFSSTGARYLPGQEMDGITLIGSDKAPLYKNIRSMVITTSTGDKLMLNNISIAPSAR